MLLDYMATDEGYKLIGWGVEGVNNSIDANGNISDKGVPDDTKFSSPKGQTVTQLRNMVFYNSDMELISRYPYFKTANGRTMGPLLYLKTFQNFPWTNVTGSGTIKPHPNNADLKRYINQGVQEFVLASVRSRKRISRLSSPRWTSSARRSGKRPRARRWTTPGICSKGRATQRYEPRQDSRVSADSRVGVRGCPGGLHARFGQVELRDGRASHALGELSGPCFGGLLDAPVRRCIDALNLPDARSGAIPADEFNLDQINAGKELFRLWKASGRQAYEEAIRALAGQLDRQPRTP
jgi:hypothetical protein